MATPTSPAPEASGSAAAASSPAPAASGPAPAASSPAEAASGPAAAASGSATAASGPAAAASGSAAAASGPAAAASSPAAATSPPFQPEPGSATYDKLPADDQATAARFKAEEYDPSIAAQQACTAQKEAAQKELDELNKQITADEAKLNADTQQLAKDKDSLDKSEQKKRSAALNAEKKKIGKEKAKAKKLNQAAKKVCKVKNPNYCVRADGKYKTANPLADISDTIIKNNGELDKDGNQKLKIDFNRLLQQEGSYSKGYVPWKPISNGASTYRTTTRGPSTDDPTLANIPVIAGNNNQSGVTIGVGVDLGQIKYKGNYYKMLDKINNEYGKILTDDKDNNKLKELKDKIDPYMGKKRARACQYLHDHPLELDADELKLLNLISIDDTLKKVTKIPDFMDWSVDRQTRKFNQVYNTGHI